MNYQSNFLIKTEYFVITLIHKHFIKLLESEYHPYTLKI